MKMVQTEMTNDIYPSRQQASPRIIERQDPVIYSTWTEDAPLTRDQVTAYERDGFLVLENVLTPAEVGALETEAAELLDNGAELEAETGITEPESVTIRSIFRVHRQSHLFGRLCRDARLVAIAQFLLGDDVYIHQSRLNFKPGFEGKDFYWHSDFETWHVEDGMPRMRALSMSVLLTPNLPVNGPTMFVPGSHKRFVACVGDTPENHYKQSLKKQEYGVPDQESITSLAERGIVMPTADAGSIVIFDCNLMHGSNSNISPFARSNAFFVFNAASNRLQAPFGLDVRRPEFISERTDNSPIVPVVNKFIKSAE